MKILISVTLLIFSSVSFATPYDAFVGCYNLVSLNGRPVSPTRVSSIKVGRPHWYYNLDKSALNGLIARILVDEPGGTLIYEPLAFDNAPGAEVTVISSQKIQFHFLGKLRSKWDSQVHSIEYSTSFEKDSRSGQVFISSNTSEDNEPSSKALFELLPIACP